jgi:hypothetical protein
MARTAKPWFNRQKNSWMVWFNGKRQTLAVGKKNRKAAEERFLELRLGHREIPILTKGTPP